MVVPVTTHAGNRLGAASLGCGAVWMCCPLDAGRRPSASAVEAVATAAKSAAVGTAGKPTPSREDVMRALHEVAQGRASPRGGDGPVRVIVPEAMAELDYCKWDGDGHFDMSRYCHRAPPSLGQVVSYVRIMEAAAKEGVVVVHLTSEAHLAVGAVLAGALLVLARKCSAQNAWAELRKATPEPSAECAKAWDRFPPPFSPSGLTTSTSCTVLDCLAGLEAARDLGWLEYRTFDVTEWGLLRRKFDASWIIPGEMLALADPVTTARNPAYPGLLSPAPTPCCGVKERMLFSPSCGSVSTMTTVASASDFLDQQMTPDTTHLGTLRSELEAKAPEAVQGCVRAHGDDLSRGCSEVTVSSFSPRSLFKAEQVEALEADDLPARPRHNCCNKQVCVCEKPGVRPSLAVDVGSWEQEAATEIESIKEDTFATYLCRKGVGRVMRLNYPCECKDLGEYQTVFEGAGMTCASFEFDDGQAPPKNIVDSFLADSRRWQDASLCGGQGPAIAIHCKAGLGRTGAIVGAYAVSKHDIDGKAFHGWMRLCRPGSVQTVVQERFLRSYKDRENAGGGFRFPLPGCFRSVVRL